MGVDFGVAEDLSSAEASLGLVDPEEEGGKGTLVSKTTGGIGLSWNKYWLLHTSHFVPNHSSSESELTKLFILSEVL